MDLCCNCEEKQNQQSFGRDEVKLVFIHALTEFDNPQLNALFSLLIFHNDSRYSQLEGVNTISYLFDSHTAWRIPYCLLAALFSHRFYAFDKR